MRQEDNMVKTGTNLSLQQNDWCKVLSHHLWFLTFKLGLNRPLSRISLEYEISGKQFNRVVGIFLQTTKRISCRPRIGDIILFYLSFTLM